MTATMAGQSVIVKVVPLPSGPFTGTFQPGTAGFRSPEHVPGGDPTPASDIFGLGILGLLRADWSTPC
jgi:eukaryotic-like serine/threonine-protein kinase